MRHVHPDVARLGEYIASVDYNDVPGRDRLGKRLEAAQRQGNIPGEIVVCQMHVGNHRAGGRVWAFYILRTKAAPLTPLPVSITGRVRAIGHGPMGRGPGLARWRGAPAPHRA